MIFALGSANAVIAGLGIIVSGTMTPTATCVRLEGLYQANVEMVGDALQAFEQCTSARRGPYACSTETRDLVTSREELQAVFSDYQKTCAARLALRGVVGKTVAIGDPTR